MVLAYSILPNLTKQWYGMKNLIFNDILIGLLDTTYFNQTLVTNK
jgi:hypothetical protein